MKTRNAPLVTARFFGGSMMCYTHAGANSAALRVGIGVSVGTGSARPNAFSTIAAISATGACANCTVIANAIGLPFHALIKRAKLQPAERIIITGAGGGVGAHAIQLAKLMGAFVMAVDIGTEKLNLARELGADVVFDSSQSDFSAAAKSWTNGESVDVVLELVGTATFDSSIKSLARGGRMVIVGSHSGTALNVSPQAIITNEWEFLGSRNVTKRELAEVVSIVEAGRVRPIVTGEFPLLAAEALHRRLRKQEIVGRVVLEP